MWGGYGKGKVFLPRVMHISIARYKRDLPVEGEALDFLVSIHEEGTGITWQQNITVGIETEKFLVEATDDLYRWNMRQGLGPRKAVGLANRLGRTLFDTFIGKAGLKVLRRVEPTAILLNVDETVLNLPWELIQIEKEPLAIRYPLGRLVTTRTMPREGRDPLEEDAKVKILAVANPTDDLAATEREMIRLKEVAENHGELIQLDILAHDEATIQNFKKRVRGGDYDILHFTGHALMDALEPQDSALVFADGRFRAEDVLKLPWEKPPYLVFNNACETGRGVGGKRLVDGEMHVNGLAAAFLTAGVDAYAGYFWPVSDAGAGLFSETFYKGLFEVQNVGLAFQQARRRTAGILLEAGDLSGLQAILIGDAASAHRRDLATMAD
jgi:hypothetical protein